MENYFLKLNSIQCVVEKKQNLNYISWSDAWYEVKKLHPEAKYTIYENEEWQPFWESKFWIDVKVWVEINWLEHIIRLPVMDWANKAMKAEWYSYKTKYWEKSVEPATTFDINKTIMRAFAKAIAMHWLGLYVFRWEDLPTDPAPKEKYTKKEFKELANSFNDWWKDLANEVYKEQAEIYEMPVDKIKKLWQVFTNNQTITDDDIDWIWKDLEDISKQVKWY